MTKYVDERGNRVSTDDTNRTVDVSGVEARQGFLGRPVLMVLIGGLVLVLLAWGGAEIFGESTDDDAATQVEQTTPSSNEATGSGQDTIDNTPAAGENAEPAPTDTDPTPQTGTGG